MNSIACRLSLCINYNIKVLCYHYWWGNVWPPGVSEYALLIVPKKVIKSYAAAVLGYDFYVEDLNVFRLFSLHEVLYYMYM